MKTCAEKTEENELPRACPVVIEEHDSKTVRDMKRREECVACDKCGRENDKFLDDNQGMS